MLSSIKFGERGWRAYALQAALSSAGRAIEVDGVFGPATEGILKAYQKANNLTADGIAGPSTQKSLIAKASHKVHERLPDLPNGLLRGYAEAEGANILAATNTTVPGGVDCGPVQLRILGPPYRFLTDGEGFGMKDAFDVQMSFIWASRYLLNRIGEYGRRNTSLSDETLLRIAVLAHNAPFMAEQVVRNGRLSTPNALATWTTKPGGGHYTHAEWMQVYPDRMMKYVTS